ncbi:M14 family metallopeptidase [Flavobacterium crassostreae]|uniref:Peptidase M14 n=1 Tax=Flavobacterium crassostreae TaxID=1763534 RepID=A0A1B9E9H5_9FLAO|nr:M14 metallopeptidase family protein [Flavobacterium crassostreae]OCB78583.1 peptidase M14 [Flavobacterium crassostreae]
MNLEHVHTQYKEQDLFGRYLTLETILPLLKKHSAPNHLSEIGKSVQDRVIYQYQIGHGKTKIFLWSQMHGNESTTTKALLDFINLLHSDHPMAKEFLDNFTFCAIPILNPDGAALYTRANANGVDLNRDSQDLSQPESKLLRAVFEAFQPDYCFNLHDQRTIFGVADSGKPATMSFLAPAFNAAREINASRLKATEVIVGIQDVLQHYLPNQIGRFDDAFNIQCIGDMFQSLGVPTVLFEAGHYAEDYSREKTRKFVFISLCAAFSSLSNNDIVSNIIDKYLNIPQNKVVFYDFIYKNVKIDYDGIEKITNFAAQYKEELVDGKLCFNAYIAKIEDLEGYFAHQQYDAQGAKYSDAWANFPELDQIATFSLGNSVHIVNGLIKK